MFQLTVDAQTRQTFWLLNRAEMAPPLSRVSPRKGRPSLASLDPHPSDTECLAGSLLQVAMATPALGFPDLDSGEFVFQSFPVHQRLTPAGSSQPSQPLEGELGRSLLNSLGFRNLSFTDPEKQRVSGWSHFLQILSWVFLSQSSARISHKEALSCGHGATTEEALGRLFPLWGSEFRLPAIGHHCLFALRPHGCGGAFFRGMRAGFLSLCAA